MITSPPPSSNTNSNIKRGAFILFEGVDRCGKTTQCGLLLKHLLSLSLAAVAFRFPDRTTSVGQVINHYLTTSAATNNLSDQAIHLLFSANRWEVAPTLAETLANGNHIVCDRYAYSGVAFTSGKENKDVTLPWCMAPDKGLPAPDVVIFLDLDQDDAEKRGGYGGERYEKRELQQRVRSRFTDLQNIDEAEGRVPWHIVDASQSIEEVQKNILTIVDETIQKLSDGKPLVKMWEDGIYTLPEPQGKQPSERVEE